MELAFEVVGVPTADSRFVFTCEHAGRGVAEWTPQASDRAFLDDHWGWDLGAGDLTRDLAGRLQSSAVLSRFSRLVCDPNRDPAEPSFVVTSVEGHELSFNRLVDAAERHRRRECYFDPYHQAIDREVRRRSEVGGEFSICSIHSFTPVYRGERREVEVGVLFDDHDDHARRLASALTQRGFRTHENAPYSGFDGLIYAARRHGRAHRLKYVELEVRHDLIDSPSKVTDVGERVADALGEIV